MEWRKYSLPHVIYDQYKSNTDNSYSRFSGGSYFLAHLSNHKDAPIATVIWSTLSCSPAILINPALVLFVFPLVFFTTVITLAILDTYSTIKYRVKLEAKKSIDWILDPEAHKKVRRGFW